MPLDPVVLNHLTHDTPEDAWRVIINKAVEIASRPLAAGNAPSEITKRDREIGVLDHFLSSSGWDLWQAFGDTVERTSDRLVRWWAEADFVVILDGRSLIWKGRTSHCPAADCGKTGRHARTRS